MAIAPTRTPRLDTGTPEELRETIRRYFHDTYDVYEALFAVMAVEDAYYRRADPLRHPLIFYLGHTATFFVNKLTLAKIIDERVDPRLESMFAIGVDEMSWDDLDDKNYDWPPLAEVWAYRAKVRAMVDRVIDELPLTVPITWDEPFWVVLMGIEHERIHLETSSVLIRHLPVELLQPHADWPICPESGEPPANELLTVTGGRVVLGKERDHPLYGWDNEYGRLEVAVEEFKAGKYLVTNREFLEFVADGGYGQEKWWSDEGWRWRTYLQAECPRFWIPDGDGSYRLRTLAAEIAMPWDWPVEVNQLEAKAFCNWLAHRTGKPIRLPTEEEWYRLLDITGITDLSEWVDEPGNINLAHFASSCPVTSFIAAGFGDVLGNVWQWTETPITGYPGFAVHPLYDDFSAPTFDTQHNLIKGGSWIATGNEATRHSRYAFRRHFYQHAGFRYVESDAPVQIRGDVYETDNLISQYCEFHWGDTYLEIPSFPLALATICREVSAGQSLENALDLGCATGRATFELARFCDRVMGIDFSARFIRVGLELKENGATRYAISDEGELVSYHERRLADFGLAEVAGRVDFRQGDAHNLKPQYTGYDLILAANLIDRLSEPGSFLSRIHERLTPGGLLVLTSPYTWLEEFTRRSAWLGGLKVDGENVTTLDGLHAVLEPRFERVGDPRDVPLVIRETRRKFQHTISELTVWRLRT